MTKRKEYIDKDHHKYEGQSGTYIKENRTTTGKPASGRLGKTVHHEAPKKK